MNRVSRVKRKRLNPKWNEVFLFEDFEAGHLHSRVLHLKAYHHDRFSGNETNGEVNFPLFYLANEAQKEKRLRLSRYISPSEKSYGHNS